jgi:hypothetical protein
MGFMRVATGVQVSDFESVDHFSLDSPVALSYSMEAALQSSILIVPQMYSISASIITEDRNEDVHHSNEPKLRLISCRREIRRCSLCLAPLLHLLRDPPGVVRQISTCLTNL